MTARDTILRHRLFSLGLLPLAGVTITPGFTPQQIADVQLLDTESWIMGPTGVPIPPQSYLTDMTNLYINPTSPFDGQPVFAVDATNPLVTPEQLYPGTGVKSLPLDTSIAQGVSILDTTIKGQIAAGNNLVVAGLSQSSTIASVEMADLLKLPIAEQPTADQLSFVLIGDPSNPDGGFLERFDLPGLPQLTIPSLGMTFSGATPADTPWNTAIYNGEYDGFADFPRYPINLLSDLNAVLGIAYVHNGYTALTAGQLAAAHELPTVGDTMTHYFMIPTQTLPLLEPLESIPVIGRPLYDLLEPDLRVLVNLGYGSITDGWDTGPANVATPIGLFPTNINLVDVVTALVSGGERGVHDFVDDMGALSLPDPASLAPNLSGVTAGGAGDSLPGLTDVVDTLSKDLATAYGAVLPTADMVNALVTTMPAYDLSIFVQELGSGDLLDAIGLPIAADLGLGTMVAGIELDLVASTIASILGIDLATAL